MLAKSIIQGRLEFGKASSFEKVLKMMNYKLETFYKHELILKVEEMIDAESFSIIVPRNIANPDRKHWNNTIDLLEYLAQYAISGYVSAWLLREGKILEYFHVEPDNEKVVVQSYIKGKKLAEQKGKEKEAMEQLNRAISKFDKHALAYERRGYVNYALGNIDDAIHDFNRCIEFDPNYAKAFFSRGKIYFKKGKIDNAIADFEAAIKNSIALQEIQWYSRLLVAECYIKKNNLKKAIFNLKLFTNRKFPNDSPLNAKKQKAFYDYAEVLINSEKYDDALAAIEKAMNLGSRKVDISEEQLLIIRGKARHLIGAQGFTADWKKAADLGSKEAKKLLTQHGAK
jgi:tetratricopeptide (TPR) repeat protein